MRRQALFFTVRFKKKNWDLGTRLGIPNFIKGSPYLRVVLGTGVPKSTGSPKLYDTGKLSGAGRGRVIILRPIIMEWMVHKTTWTNLRFRKAKVEEIIYQQIPLTS